MATSMKQRGRLYTADALDGRKVVNYDGENLGEIKDVVIDSSSGCVAYAVLSYHSGFLNMGNKRFAVPWEALKFDEAHRDVILDIDKDRLRDAPGFEKDQWPTEPNQEFGRSVDEYYGYDAQRRESGGYGTQSQEGGGYGDQSREGGGYGDQSREGGGYDTERQGGMGYGTGRREGSDKQYP